MAVKLVVLYTQPEDVSAFDDHYVGRHMPLVDVVPGLVKAETSKFVAAPDGGEQTYFRMAEFYFDSLDDLQAGLASEAAPPPPRTTGASLPRAAGCSLHSSTDPGRVTRE